MPQKLKKIGLFLIVIGALFLLAQLGLRVGADYYLRERAKIPIRIGHLFINPATSRVTLSFQGEKSGQELKLDLGAVRFDWWTVILKRIRLGNISIEGLHLDVEKEANGKMIVGGIPLAANSSTPGPENKTPSEPERPNPHPWGVGIGQIDLKDIHLQYKDPLMTVVVMIRRFHMDPAESWHADRPTPFDLDMDVNGGHLQLSGSAFPFKSDPTVDSHIQLTDLPLAWLQPSLQASGIHSLDGFLEIDAKTSATYRKSSLETNAAMDGTISLKKFEVAGPALGPDHIGFDGAFVFDGFHVTVTSGSALVQAKAFEIQNGQLRVADKTLRPAFRWALDKLALKVSDIDSGSSNSIVPYSLTAQVGRYEKIDLKGKWSPFNPVPDGQVDLKIDGLNLTAFSTYSENHIGYRLGTGLFDLKTKANVRHGLLESTNGLVAHKLHFDKLSAAEMDESAKQIGLPLNLCLGLIRDADDNIRLDIPLAGDLRDPKTPIGKLVWTLIGKALVSALRAAATAFFPSGDKIGFDPIPFAAGQGTLSPEAVAYLSKVGEKLKQRPEVGLKLSGLAVEADWYAMRRKKIPEPAVALDQTKLSDDDKTKLLALGAARAEAMRAYLADTFQLDPKRLLGAAPQIDGRVGGIPHAEISL